MDSWFVGYTIFGVAIFSELNYYGIIPFAILFFALVILNFRVVFFLMLLMLPVSVEAYLGSFGTDLPSEPIVILLAGCTFLFLVFNRQEINRKSYKHPIFIMILVLYCWMISQCKVSNLQMRSLSK